MHSPRQTQVSFPITLLSFLFGTLVSFRVGQLSSNSILKFVADNVFPSHDATCKVLDDLTKTPPIQNFMDSTVSYYGCVVQKDISFNILSSHSSETGRLNTFTLNSEMFYEAFVQPAMFMHTNAKRVAVIGTGEGSTLKEVLKHKTVEVVKVIGADEDYSREWNRCSDMIDGTEWCGDDSRVEFINKDASHWFSAQCRMKQLHSTIHNEEQFHVVIIDILNFPFFEELYKDNDFIHSLFESLSDDGIIAFHIGKSPKYSDPADEYTRNSKRKTFINLLSEAGFQELFMYEDANASSDDPSLFLLVAKDWSTRSYWFRNTAQSDFETFKRIRKSLSGENLLEYFDGSVLEAFRAPHRVMETIYCRSSPMPVECIKNRKVQDIPLSNLRVGPSSIGDGSGRGLFTDIDIKEGSTIARKSANNPIKFPPSAYDLMMKYYDISVDHQALHNYMDGYGWQSEFYGRTSYFVDSSILSFVNHGCHGTYNIGDSIAEGEEITTEQNATVFDQEQSDLDHTFNPFGFRHEEPMFEQAIRDIKAGEELFCDYTFYTTGKHFNMSLDELKKMCNGEKSIGLITQVEMRKANTTNDQ